MLSSCLKCWEIWCYRNKQYKVLALIYITSNFSLKNFCSLSYEEGSLVHWMHGHRISPEMLEIAWALELATCSTHTISRHT